MWRRECQAVSREGSRLDFVSLDATPWPLASAFPFLDPTGMIISTTCWSFSWSQAMHLKWVN